MNARLQEFDQHCVRLNEAIREIPDTALRERIRTLIEELSLGLNTKWIGCRVVWVDKIPDSPEGIEDL